MELVRDSGFTLPDNVIHLFIGGSELHGAKVQGTDDLDIYGIYVEPPELALGMESLPHFVWSSAGNDRRNGPHDVDITLYSLKKWAGLACKGNPTALHFLFAEGVMANAVWNEIVQDRSIFLARQCLKQFLGFAEDQLKRITGAKGRGKKGQRPEMESKYGYDVKAAMHTLRLLYECRELMSEGKITFPRPEREYLVDVRSGKFTVDKILLKASELVVECKKAAKVSALPDKVNRQRVSLLVANAYRTTWDAATAK